MRLGRKLSEGFAVDQGMDHEVDPVAPAGHTVTAMTDRTPAPEVPATARAAGQPVGSGQPPVG